MSYDQYNMVFMIGLVMAGVFLLLSVLLLFVLRIPAVIGYLSGSTERKAISATRKSPYRIPQTSAEPAQAARIRAIPPPRCQRN